MEHSSGAVPGYPLQVNKPPGRDSCFKEPLEIAPGAWVALQVLRAHPGAIVAFRS